VPYDQDGEYDWKVMQRNANLYKKSPAMIEEHYVELLERCRSTIHLFKEMEKKKGLREYHWRLPFNISFLTLPLFKKCTGGRSKGLEDEVVLKEGGDEMTYVQAMKVLQRIILFSKIRGKALKLSEEELRFRLVSWKSLPLL